MSTIDIQFIELLNQSKTESYGDRISLILEQKKRSKAWLAAEIGISKQALNYLITHSSGYKYLDEISATLDVTPLWLKTGEGNITLQKDDGRDIINLPLLEMHEVPNRNSFIPDEKKFILTSNSLPRNSFAVTLGNKSMEPNFIQGSTLIFDPDLKPKSGDFIIFSLQQSDEIYFRQYLIDGQDIYLKSVDTMYRTIKNEKITIYGVLVESRNKFN